MFEMSIEEVLYTYLVEIHIKSGRDDLRIRAKYVEDDDYVCISESKHRVSPVYVHVNNIDLELDIKENLKNFLFEWIISEEGTDFMRLVFDSKPPKVGR